MLCPFCSAPFPPFLSVDDRSSVPAFSAVHPSAQRRWPSHHHRSTSDRPALQAASLVNVECYYGAMPPTGVHDVRPQAAEQIVIAAFTGSLIYLIVRRHFFSILGVCIVLSTAVDLALNRSQGFETGPGSSTG